MAFSPKKGLFIVFLCLAIVLALSLHHTAHLNGRLLLERNVADFQLEQQERNIAKAGLVQSVHKETIATRASIMLPNNVANASPSKGEEVKLLLVVKSAPGYFERRERVRRNWFHKCSSNSARLNRQDGKASFLPKRAPAFVNSNLAIYVACYFVVGQSRSKLDRTRVAEEMEKYGDVFEASLIDDYETMTSKTQWTLFWSLKEDYTYLALIDDDAVVVFSNFLPWLAEQPRVKFYAGHQHLWLGVKRCDTPEQIKKNCVSPDMYPVKVGNDNYEPFASGFGYLISRDAVIGSVQAALGHLSNPGLPGNVEDAMLGVLLAEAGIHLKNVPEFYHWIHDGPHCPKDKKILVLGNAPDYVLERIAENERNGRPLCSHGM